MIESSIQHKDYEYHSSTYHVPLVRSQCNSFNLYLLRNLCTISSILEPNFLEFWHIPQISKTKFIQLNLEVRNRDHLNLHQIKVFLVSHAEGAKLIKYPLNRDIKFFHGNFSTLKSHPHNTNFQKPKSKLKLLEYSELIQFTYGSLNYIVENVAKRHKSHKIISFVFLLVTFQKIASMILQSGDQKIHQK